MSAFGDLFRLFPAKMAELCIEEACTERRPVYLFDVDMPLIEQRPQCLICGRIAVFHWRDDRWLDYCEPPFPDMTQDACEDAWCVELLAWFTAKGRDGSRRRRAYKEKFGKYWGEGEPDEERATSMALVMLEFTIREKSDAANRSRAA